MEFPDTFSLFGCLQRNDDLKTAGPTVSTAVQPAFPETRTSMGNNESYEELLAKLREIPEKLQHANADEVTIPPGSEPFGRQLGNYEIIETLGTGGMGVVFKARHTRLKRIVALKLMPEGWYRQREHVSRFEREMEAIGRLDHPHIVRATDASEVDGRLFLVMEYVEGKDLDSVVQEQGPLPVARAVDYVIQAARGLQYAHSQGIIHRDIKPSNLILSPMDTSSNREGNLGDATLLSGQEKSGGRIKVLDLGLARLREDQPVANEVTAVGQAMGSVDYMSPEQAEDARSVDHRTDMYGLGCTLYKLITGNPPYQGETALNRILAHREHPIPSLRAAAPEVSGSLDSVFRKMVAKDPADRYGSMDDLIAALQACLPDAASSMASPASAPDGRSVATPIPPPPPVSFTAAGTPPQTDTVPGESGVVTVTVRPMASRSQPSPGMWKRVAVGVLLVAAIMVVGLVIVIKTRQGTLTIEGADDRVVVSVLKGGDEIQVLDADNQWALRLTAGQYRLEMKKGGDTFELSEDTVVVRRGEEVRVRLSMHKTAASSVVGSRPPGASRADRPTVDPSAASTVHVDPGVTVLRNANPAVLGKGEDRRIGFADPGNVFKTNRPELGVDWRPGDGDRLNVTQLFYCRVDNVRVPSSGPRPRVREREVNLWVPVDSELSPCASAVFIGGGKQSLPDGQSVVQIDRELPDGVYCLHTGEFTNEGDLPDFATPFVVQGWGEPTIDGKPSVEVDQGDHRIRLSVPILNKGQGQFRDGILIVTLQKEEGEGSAFQKRSNTYLDPIPTGATKTVVVELDAQDFGEGTYYFYGHVNYRHLWDVNELCELESPRFTLPANGEPEEDNAQ
jgi:serine/threonine protein kinase